MVCLSNILKGDSDWLVKYLKCKSHLHFVVFFKLSELVMKPRTKIVICSEAFESYRFCGGWGVGSLFQN